MKERKQTIIWGVGLIALVRLQSWKGKSSIRIINKPDKFIVVTFQKKDQNSTLHEVRREVSKVEVNEIITAINSLDKKIEYWDEKKKAYLIPSRDIGELAYNKDWDTEIFCKRFLHNQLNAVFRILDYYGLTEYRGGFSRILKNTTTIQEALK